jgi:PAS domain S-box-containing protein
MEQQQVTTDARLESILNILIEFSRGNFSAKAEITEEDDSLNSVISGLNMLGEELANYKFELKEQAAFLQNILSSIDEIIYAREILHDTPPLSPFTFISKSSEEIIGLTSEELNKEPDKWSKIIHVEDRARLTDTIKSVLSGQESVFIYRLYHPVKKQYRWLEDRVVPHININTGLVTHIFGSVRDITDKQETAIQLGETNELVSRLISSSDQSFYIISIDTENSFANNFTYLSWQIENMLGCTIEDIKKDQFGWIRSIHPDDIEHVKNENRRMFSTKKPITRIYRIKHAQTNEYIWIEDYVLPVANGTGLIKELYGSARDITKRKTVELEREELMTELSKRYNELAQFNYIVSHNLRAPVVHILGLAQLLGTQTSGTEQKETIGYILEAAETMDELLHDLNVILSTRSTLNEKVERFLLSEVINLISTALKKEIDTTAARITTDIHPDAVELTSIKSYIQSAIFNLVNNAIKFRSEDRLPVIHIVVYNKDDNTIITVTDNGKGIDLETNRDKIFGLYSKLNFHYEGKGLGLYMTKTQIESLGGTITVDSTEGVGTTFTISLATNPQQGK